MKEKLQHAFQSGLGLEAPIDYASLVFAKSHGWDSVAHMRLVAALEEAFGLDLSMEEILALDSYNTAEKIIGERCDRF